MSEKNLVQSTTETLEQNHDEVACKKLGQMMFDLCEGTNIDTARNNLADFFLDHLPNCTGVDAQVKTESYKFISNVLCVIQVNIRR